MRSADLARECYVRWVPEEPQTIEHPLSQVPLKASAMAVSFALSVTGSHGPNTAGHGANTAEESHRRNLQTLTHAPMEVDRVRSSRLAVTGSDRLASQYVTEWWQACAHTCMPPFHVSSLSPFQSLYGANGELWLRHFGVDLVEVLDADVMSSR